MGCEPTTASFHTNTFDERPEATASSFQMISTNASQDSRVKSEPHSHPNATNSPPTVPSSARLIYDLRLALRRGGHSELRRVEICLDDKGIVILKGRVPSFYLKQLAQEIARGMVPDDVLCNRLEVSNNPHLPR